MRVPAFSCFYARCISAAFLLLSINSNAQNENALLYHGNAFYWTDSRTDTVRREDAETGEVVLMLIRREAAITKMNQETIYNAGDEETVRPVFEYNSQDAAAYFKSIVKTRYPDMPGVAIQKMVIGQSGRPVYFELVFDDANIDRATRLKWRPVIEKLIVNMPRWQPGRYKNRLVLFYLDAEIHIP